MGLLLRNHAHLRKYFEVKTDQNKNTMETYSSLQKPITFMYFWLNYCDKNRIERIPVAVKDIDHLFNITSEIVEADSLHLFLLSDGTRIDDN